MNCLNSEDFRGIGCLGRFLVMLLGFIFWPLGLLFSLYFSFQVSVMEGIATGAAAICCCFCDKRLNPKQNLEKICSNLWLAFLCCPCFLLFLSIFLLLSFFINITFCLALTVLAALPVYFFLIFYYVNYLKYHTITKCCISRRRRNAANWKKKGQELQMQEQEEY